MEGARTAAIASLASRWSGTAAIVSLKGKRRGVKGERRNDCSAIGRWVSVHIYKGFRSSRSRVEADQTSSHGSVCLFIILYIGGAEC
jgi:hypothetical protein